MAEKKRKKKGSEIKDEEKKEEICEIFEVEKDGKEETIKSCGIEEKKTPSEKQIKNENKILRNVFIILVMFIGLFVILYFLLESFKQFEVEGVKFDIVKEGGLMLYRTYLPVKHLDKITGKIIDTEYNFYLRNDPRKLIKEIPFDGNIALKELMVVNITGSDFKCEGDGVIGIANLVNLYNVLGTDVIKNDNETCDDIYGRYLFLRINPGNETRINDFGLKGGCYNTQIKDCEILEATERFMLETFIEVNRKLKR